MKYGSPLAQGFIYEYCTTNYTFGHKSALGSHFELYHQSEKLPLAAFSNYSRLQLINYLPCTHYLLDNQVDNTTKPLSGNIHNKNHHRWRYVSLLTSPTYGTLGGTSPP